jgi:phosphatidylglycerophosphate synthase
MNGNKADAVRIQTSILNAAEKKVLVWLAERQPSWMTSDILTYLGTFGAVVIAVGYILSSCDMNWLWLSSLGFVINWYGDSLDGTLARVRNRQRPIYGYYLDHTVDAVNELIIVLGIGLSGMVHLSLALLILALYFMLTVNVSINAHLKKEFRLTYAKMGPTELRIIMIIVNTVLVLIPSIGTFSHTFMLWGHELTVRTMDYVAAFIFLALLLIYLTEIVKDAKEYARLDPPKR